MFFCDDCADRNRWPVSLATSYGQCEICRQVASCNDVPSRLLPTLDKDLD